MSRFIRRYRRVNATKAFKAFSPLFTVDADELVVSLTEYVQ